MELEMIKEDSKFQEKVAELLVGQPGILVQNLRHLISYGEDRCSRCKFIIDFLKATKKTDILYEEHEEQTVLHLAATFHTCDELVLRIVSACPKLSYASRTGDFQGQNFLHILIAKGAVQTAIAFLRLEDVDITYKFMCIGLDLDLALATGSKFANTILMGETVLSAAALNFNEQLFQMLFEFGVSVDDQNSKGDTVLHTLIRYVHANKQCLDTVLKFLDFLQRLMLEPKDTCERRWGIRYTKTVWFTENDEHQTPLQLAASLGEAQLFTYIINLQWVYRVLYDYDGLFDNNKYDVTEVDTLAKLKWLKDRRIHMFTAPRFECSRLKKYICVEDAVLSRHSSPSILDVVCQINVHAACRIMQSPVLQTLLENKWKHYARFFFIWALLHFFGSISLSVYAFYKIQYQNWLDDKPKFTSENGTVFITNTTQSINDTTQKSLKTPDISPSHELFVMIFCCLLFGPALLFLYLEYVRTFVQRRPWNLLLVHHNGAYRLMHLLMYLCFFVDSVWFLVNPSTNPKGIIVLAVLLSWFFMTFFLRPYRKFSFYTVMLQKVLFSDMLRFSAVILLELVSFTVAMRLLFLHNQPVPDEFGDFPGSLLTMFKLMLGLADLEILNKADPEWLAIVLFVTYVLITYVLLINSLIAMMSNTCSAIEQDKFNVWQVQRLSVILFMEHLLMIFGLATTLGKKHYIVKFRNQQETRYVIEVSQSVTPSVRGADIARHRRYLREDTFDDDLQNGVIGEFSARKF